MSDKDRILLVNRICDEYESLLQTGEVTQIEEAVESVESTYKDPDLVAVLLPELIALWIFYSGDRDATAAELKSKFPQQSGHIHRAVSQPSLLGTINRAADETGTYSASSVQAPTIRPVYADIAGRFENLRHHASGGLGDVYVGYDNTVRRNVAVKLLKPEMVTNTEAKNRFLNEGAITGGLEHPGIIPVYDAGVTEDGQPFYAMRLMDGKNLKDAIAQLHAKPRPNDFDEQQRDLLRRLVDVCEAISYAHSREVIHRDLKPANILLGAYGETVVIDWGLARNQESSDQFASLDKTSDFSSTISQRPLQTKLGEVLGTPEYMSPEQASGDPAATGKPSDVYSLGAVLYCILTGASPHGDGREMTQDRIAQARNSAFTSARERNPNVPLSLNAICEKAMHAEPTRRYESPSAIARDLDNWLTDQPVAARPDSLLEKGARFLRKHRRWAAAAAVTLVAVTIGSVIAATVISGQRTEIEQRKVEAEQQTEIQTELARKEAASARAASEANVANTSYVRFMDNFFKQLGPDAGGRNLKLSEALDQLAAAAKSNTELSEEAKLDVYANLCNGYRAIGDENKYLKATQEYVRMIHKLRGANSFAAVDAQGALVGALTRVGESMEALDLADKTLEMLRSDNHSQIENGVVKQKAIDIMRLRLTALQLLERSDEVVSAWEEMYPWLKNLDLETAPTTVDELQFASQYVDALRVAGSGEKALEWQKKIYESQKAILGTKHTKTLGNLYRLSRAVQSAQGYEAALPYQQELVEVASEVFGPEHHNTLVARANLANIHYFVGRYGESRVRFDELRKIYLRKRTAFGDLLGVEYKLARSLLHLDAPEQALKLLESIVARAKDDDNIQVFGGLDANIKRFLFMALLESGRVDEAIDHLSLTIDAYIAAEKPENNFLVSMRQQLQLASLLNRDFDAALAHRQYVSEEIKPDTFVSAAQTAEALFELGQTTEAEEMIESLLEVIPDDGKVYPFVILVKCMKSNLKGLLAQIIAETDPERSEQLLVQAVTELHNGYEVVLPNVRVKAPLARHADKLIELFESTDRMEEAKAWRQKLGQSSTD